MAETDSVLFHGGPCSGRTEQRLLSDLQDGRVACGGTIYRSYEVYDGTWLALLPSAKPPAVTATPTAPKATRAWNRLIHSMHVGVPAEMTRARAARVALLRSGRR